MAFEQVKKVRISGSEKGLLSGGNDSGSGLKMKIIVCLVPTKKLC